MKLICLPDERIFQCRSRQHPWQTSSKLGVLSNPQARRAQDANTRAFKALAKELVLSLAEMTGAKKTRKSTVQVGAKYRHPENRKSLGGGGRKPG
jgi:hypothetical protein